jgi:hypothetical protein
MSYRVTIHSSAPIGHHGYAKIVSYESRAGAEAYARTARQEDPDATVQVDGQHEEPPATLERARAWMAHLNDVLANAPHFTDHHHHGGHATCPICAA